MVLSPKHLCAAVLSLLLTSACAPLTSGPSVTANIDEELVTGAIDAGVIDAGAIDDGDENSDPELDTLLRVLVESGPSNGSFAPIAWRDQDTDIGGEISRIGAADPQGCRRFVTTRERFDGVSLYQGLFCGPEGGWRVHGYKQL